MPNRPTTSRPLPDKPMSFLMRYMRARRWQFGGLFSVIMGAAACAVLVQYGMKLLVDAMAAPDRATADVWTPLALFLGLIAVENVLWRTGGWLGCRTVVATGVDMRLDLFQHLTGHPIGISASISPAPWAAGSPRRPTPPA